MKKDVKIKVISILLTIVTILSASYTLAYGLKEEYGKTTTTANVTYYAAGNTDENQYVYLSDMNFLKATTAWSSVIKDKTSSNGEITLMLENSYVTFDKGIWAHANSEIVIDISSYNKDYKYFTTYYGVNKTSNGKGNGVKFYVYTSEDNKNWTLRTAENPTAMMSNQNAGYLKIDISGANYLRLVANDNGSNGNDHSVWADSKLITENYSDNVTKTVEQYDEEIRAIYNENNGKIVDDNSSMSKELELLVLQRELVAKAGQYQLRKFLNEGGNHVEAFNWLMNDLDILRLYIHGGEPAGNYYNSLNVLSDLYAKYKDDMNDSKNGELYTKMIITISLTHSTLVRFWINDRVLKEDGSIVTNGDSESESISTPVNRYEIYKELYDKEQLDTEVFKTLTVEEMRCVLGNNMADDEIKWANYYTTINNSRNPYSYIKYINTFDYYNTKYYEGETYESYKDKYKLDGYDKEYKEIYGLTDYSVVNKPYYVRLWIIMTQGGVCWQISDIGQNLHSSHGVPSVTVGQPGHVAYLVREEINGKSKWGMWNGVSPWYLTSTIGYTNTATYHQIRMLNGWGNGSYASTFSASYILLGAAALDDYDNYVKAENIYLLANSLTDSKQKEAVYREALKVQSFNFDVLLALVDLYINDDKKTDKELYDLAVKVANNLTYYPLPMYDLLRKISPKIESAEYQIQLTLLQTNTLQKATKATSNEHIQYDVVRTMANYLLGVVDTEVASFSFDGENAGVISLADKYKLINSNWDFSLDGGKTWIDVTSGDSFVKLGDEQINSITAENDIKIHIVGTGYNEENIYTIDIKNSTLPSTIYANDYENKVMGTTSVMEWIYSEKDNWTKFSDKEPDLTGDTTIQVRIGRNGTYLESNASNMFTFTSKYPGDNKTRSYISTSRMNVVGYSSQETRQANNAAINAIDGNTNTIWHTNWTAGSDTQRYYTIELDQPTYICGLDYLPRQDTGTNGIITKAEIAVSMDGENWTIVTTESWAADKTLKSYTFKEPIQAKYVKITGVEALSGFMSASMFILYEDTTKIDYPIAAVTYNTLTPTNQDVIATLTDASTDITITNNGGSNTYKFTENGEFTFEFEDEKGIKGTATAIVNWIDKEKPTATVEYSTTNKTTGSVVATIVFSEDVKLLKGNIALERYEEDKTSENDNIGDTTEKIYTANTKYTLTFGKNVDITLEYADRVGNANNTPIKITWIEEKQEDLEIDDSKDPVVDNPVTDEPITDDPIKEDDPVIDKPIVDDNPTTNEQTEKDTKTDDNNKSDSTNKNVNTNNNNSNDSNDSNSGSSNSTNNSNNSNANSTSGTENLDNSQDETNESTYINSDENNGQTTIEDQTTATESIPQTGKTNYSIYVITVAIIALFAIIIGGQIVELKNNKSGTEKEYKIVIR